MIHLLIHLALLLALPPLLLGVINKTKAFIAGRKGPPVLQLYFDIFKLMQKNVVLSTTTSWIFVASPVVAVVTVLLAGLLMPLGPFHAPLGFTGDLILFAYLLALSRFFTTAADLGFKATARRQARSASAGRPANWQAAPTMK